MFVCQNVIKVSGNQIGNVNGQFSSIGIDKPNWTQYEKLKGFQSNVRRPDAKTKLEQVIEETLVIQDILQQYNKDKAIFICQSWCIYNYILFYNNACVHDFKKELIIQTSSCTDYLSVLTKKYLYIFNKGRRALCMQLENVDMFSFQFLNASLQDYIHIDNQSCIGLLQVNNHVLQLVFSIENFQNHQLVIKHADIVFAVTKEQQCLFIVEIQSFDNVLIIHYMDINLQQQFSVFQIQCQRRQFNLTLIGSTQQDINYEFSINNDTKLKILSQKVKVINGIYCGSKNIVSTTEKSVKYTQRKFTNLTKTPLNQYVLIDQLSHLTFTEINKQFKQINLKNQIKYLVKAVEGTYYLERTSSNQSFRMLSERQGSQLLQYELFTENYKSVENETLIQQVYDDSTTGIQYVVKYMFINAKNIANALHSIFLLTSIDLYSIHIHETGVIQRLFDNVLSQNLQQFQEIMQELQQQDFIDNLYQLQQNNFQIIEFKEKEITFILQFMFTPKSSLFLKQQCVEFIIEVAKHFSYTDAQMLQLIHYILTQLNNIINCDIITEYYTQYLHTVIAIINMLELNYIKKQIRDKEELQTLYSHIFELVNFILIKISIQRCFQMDKGIQLISLNEYLDKYKLRNAPISIYLCIILYQYIDIKIVPDVKINVEKLILKTLNQQNYNLNYDTQLSNTIYIASLPNILQLQQISQIPGLDLLKYQFNINGIIQLLEYTVQGQCYGFQEGIIEIPSKNIIDYKLQYLYYSIKVNKKQYKKSQVMDQLQQIFINISHQLYKQSTNILQIGLFINLINKYSKNTSILQINEIQYLNDYYIFKNIIQEQQLTQQQVVILKNYYNMSVEGIESYDIDQFTQLGCVQQLIFLNCFSLEFYDQTSQLLKNKLRQNYNNLQDYISILLNLELRDQVILLIIQVIENINIELANRISQYIFTSIPTHYSQYDTKLYEILQDNLDETCKETFKILQVFHQLQIPMSPSAIINGLDDESLDRIAEFLATDEHIQKLSEIKAYLNDKNSGNTLINKIIKRVMSAGLVNQYLVQYLMETSPDCFIIVFLNQLLLEKDISTRFIQLQKEIVRLQLQFMNNKLIQNFISVVKLNYRIQIASLYPQVVLLIWSQLDMQTQHYFRILATQLGFKELLTLTQDTCQEYIIEQALYFQYYVEKFASNTFESFFTEIMQLLSMYRDQNTGQTVNFILYKFFKQKIISQTELKLFFNKKQINYQHIFSINLTDLIKIYENDISLQQIILYNINFVFESTDQQDIKIICMFILSILGQEHVKDSEIDNQSSTQLALSDQQSSQDWGNSIVSPEININSIYIPQYNEKVIMQMFTDTQNDILARVRPMQIKSSSQKTSVSDKYQINLLFEQVIQEVKQDNYDGFYQLILYYFVKKYLKVKDVSLEQLNNYYNEVVEYIFNLKNKQQVDLFSQTYLTNVLMACKVNKIESLFDGLQITNIIQKQQNNLELFTKITTANKYRELSKYLDYIQQQLPEYRVDIQNIADENLTIDLELIVHSQHINFDKIKDKIKYLDSIYTICQLQALSMQQSAYIFSNIIQIIIERQNFKYQEQESLPQYILAHYKSLLESQSMKQSFTDDCTSNLNLSAGQSNFKSQSLLQSYQPTNASQQEKTIKTVSGWDQESSSSSDSSEQQQSTQSQAKQSTTQNTVKSGWDIHSSGNESTDNESAQSSEQKVDQKEATNTFSEELKLSHNEKAQDIAIDFNKLLQIIEQMKAQSPILFNQRDIKLEFQLFIVFMIQNYNIQVTMSQLVKLNLHLALTLHLMKKQNNYDEFIKLYITQLIFTQKESQYQQILLEFQNIKEYLGFYSACFINMTPGNAILQELDKKFILQIVNKKDKAANVPDLILDNLDIIDVDQIACESLQSFIRKFKKLKQKKFESTSFYKIIDQQLGLQYSAQKILCNMMPPISKQLQAELLKKHILNVQESNKKPQITPEKLIALISEKQFYQTEIASEIFIYVYEIIHTNQINELLTILEQQSYIIIAQIITYCLIIKNEVMSELNNPLNQAIQLLIEKSQFRYYFTDNNNWLIFNVYDENDQEDKRYIFPAQIAKWISHERFIEVQCMAFVQIFYHSINLISLQTGNKNWTTKVCNRVLDRTSKRAHCQNSQEKRRHYGTNEFITLATSSMPKNYLASQIKLRTINRGETADDKGIYEISDEKNSSKEEKPSNVQEQSKSQQQTQSPQAKQPTTKKGILNFVSKKETVVTSQQHYNKKFPQEDIFMQTRQYNKQFKSFDEMLSKSPEEVKKISFAKRGDFENDYKENLVNLLIRNEIDARQADATRMMIIGHFETLEQLLYPAKQKTDGFAVNVNTNQLKDNLNEMRNKNIIRFANHIKKTLGDSIDNPNVQDKIREDLGFNSGLASIYIQSRVFFGYIPDPPLNSPNIYINPLTIEDKIDYDEATQGFDDESESESTDESTSEDDSSENSDSNELNINENHLQQADKLEDDLDDNQDDDDEFADEKELQMNKLVPLKRQKSLFKALRRRQHNFTYPIPALCPEGLSGTTEKLIIFDLRKQSRKLEHRERNVIKTDDDVAEVIINAFDDVYDGKQTINGNVVIYDNQTLNRFYEPIIIDADDLKTCNQFVEAEKVVQEVEEDDNVLE